MNREEVNRQSEYCQLRKEIRGSEEHLIVGIDIAKDKHYAFMGTATGKTLLKKLVFDNNAEGFNKLIWNVSAKRDQNGLFKVVFGMEPTGNYHKPLGSYLISCGYQVVLVSGVSVKRNRELLDGRWDKHDRKCAANIADLISQGKCLFYAYPEAKIKDLRALLSLRRRLKREEHSLRMRIRNSLLAKFFPELDRHYGSCVTESLAIVRWCLAPDRIRELGFEQFFNMVTTRERGLAQRRRLERIYHLATESIGCPMNEASEFEAGILVEKVKQVHQEISETAELIKAVSSKFPEYHLLLTIPGFGPYISALVLSAIGDPFRFESRKQVIRMAGLDLCANRSGKTSETATPVISKRGNSELRYGLYQAALVASTSNETFARYYTTILCGREREKGIKTKMKVKLAVKMLVIAWTMMKTKTDFDPRQINTD